MAYFANGAEGMDYMEHYCMRCVNWNEGCYIIDLHSLWNYDAVGAKADETKRIALDHFIPRDGIKNLQCKMFLERGAATP